MEEQIDVDSGKVDELKDGDRPGSELKIESDSFSEEGPTASSSDNNPKSAKPEIVATQIGKAMEEDEEEDEPPPKKQKQLVKEPEQFQPPDAMVVEATETKSTRKGKKKKKSTRKGKKKKKCKTNTPTSVAVEDKVLITPVPRFPAKSDDTPDLEICLSKVYKAEEVEISEDRLSAGSSKGYTMVRATRGAIDGAWYFEIKVVNLGETGHTRLGWSTDKGDLQAPVGYDGNSFGFSDIDGCKIHKDLSDKYAEEGYREGDVIGFYINLPDGESFAPKPPDYVSAPDTKEEPPKVIPGSEIFFFKNGVCQGVAFSDLFGGRYYPAASMYTLPDQSNCVVKFNFGPDFEFFPADFRGRAIPRPMCEVPYHGYNGRLENSGSEMQQVEEEPEMELQMSPDYKKVKEIEEVFKSLKEQLTPRNKHLLTIADGSYSVLKPNSDYGEIVLSWTKKNPKLISEPLDQEYGDCWSHAFHKGIHAFVKKLGLDIKIPTAKELVEEIDQRLLSNNKGLLSPSSAVSFLAEKYGIKMVVYHRPKEDNEEENARFEQFIEQRLAIAPVAICFNFVPGYRWFHHGNKAVFCPSATDLIIMRHEIISGHCVVITGRGVVMKGGESTDFFEIQESRGHEFGSSPYFRTLSKFSNI